MKKLHRIYVLVAATCLTGCASTKLKLNLDLYREDPSYLVFLTPARVNNLLHSLALAEAEATALARDRTALSQNLLETYLAIQALTGIPTGSKTLKEAFVSYESKIKNKATEVSSLCDTARTRLQKFVELLGGESQFQPKEVIGGINPALHQAHLDLTKSAKEITRALASLGKPLENDDFESGFIELWSVVKEGVAEDKLKPLFKNRETTPEFNVLRQKVNDLAKEIQQLSERGHTIVANVSTKLQNAVNDKPADQSELKAAMDALAKASSEVPISIGLGDRGQTALNELSRSFGLFYSQIDRLQDPADPVWRIIAAPENSSKWDTAFSETYFFAEGNSSIIIVRDSPISFRIQQGKNNPAALIQGQLQISRALADAAISVASASLDSPLIPPREDTKPANETRQAQPSNGEDMAYRRTQLEEKANLRAHALRNLKNNLMGIRSEMKPAAQNNKKQVEELRLRLQALLNAHKSVLQTKQQTQ